VTVRHPRLRWTAPLAGVLLVSLLPATGTGAAGTTTSSPRTGSSAPRVERVVIGTSVQGRPIIAVHRWRPGATSSLLVVGNLHGDERAGLRVVHRLRTRALPADVDLWTIRSANPDGTAADRRTNAHGVDLNRNFPRRWLRAGGGTTKWSGPTSASEPETRALIAFVQRVHPHTTVVVHQPLYGVDAYRAKSMTLVRALSQQSGLPVRSFDCQGGCHGTFTDWHNARTPGRAVTVEFGTRAADAQIARLRRAVLTVARR
jgi:murein peptide amidase A